MTDPITSYRYLKLAVKNTIMIATYAYLTSEELEEFGASLIDKDLNNFYHSCIITEGYNSVEDKINIEYNNMLNKAKAFNRLSEFIGLIGSACNASIVDFYEQFMNENKCEYIDNNKFKFIREEIKINLIKEALI